MFVGLTKEMLQIYFVTLYQRNKRYERFLHDMNFIHLVFISYVRLFLSLNHKLHNVNFPRWYGMC